MENLVASPGNLLHPNIIVSDEDCTFSLFHFASNDFFITCKSGENKGLSTAEVYNVPLEQLKFSLFGVQSKGRRAGTVLE